MWPINQNLVFGNVTMDPFKNKFHERLKTDNMFMYIVGTPTQFLKEKNFVWNHFRFNFNG